MNLKYILIVIILAVLVGGGILLLIPKEEAEIPEIKPPEEVKVPEEAPVEEVVPEPEEVLPEDETVDWQEFTDESFGYSIRYPKGWRYFDCSEAQYGGPCFLSNDYISSGGDPVDMIVSADQIFVPIQGMSLAIVNLADEVEPGEVVPCAVVSPEEQEICEDIQVGDFPAAKFTDRKVFQIFGFDETLVQTFVYINQETNFYMIIFLYPECERRFNPDGSTLHDCSNIDEAPTLFDQILSNLIFL